MRTLVLVVNAGSSSLKFALFESAGGALARRHRGAVEGLGGAPRFRAAGADGPALADEALPAGTDHGGALVRVLDWISQGADAGRVAAAGHRVVHGGARFAAPVRVDGAVLDALRHLVPLAPLHQPHNLAPIETLARLRPEVPQVACFDTAFHRTMPVVARTYALPRALTHEGVQRYGFHGLSYEHVAGVLPALAGRPLARVVIAHLGHGASLCAVRDGRSVATTMGFTALEGLPMGTRSGSIDPAIVLHLLRERGLDLDAVTDLLHERSGLLGVSGISGDMRVLLESRAPEAAEAVDLFVYRVGRELGSLAAALGGLDALVFTGGIGEHAVPVRARVCRDAAWLGVALDDDANARSRTRISRDDSPVSVWVIPTDEEGVIARHTAAVLGIGGDGR